MALIFFLNLVCSYVDIGPDQALDISLRSPSEDSTFPLENILQPNSKLLYFTNDANAYLIGHFQCSKWNKCR